YQAEYAAMTAEIDAVNTADNDADRDTRVQKALEHLKAKTHKKRQLPFDPKKLPNQMSDGKVRPPKETKEELEQLIHAQADLVQVAALALNAGMLAQSTAQTTTAPQAADLAPTEDVQITDDIKALAVSLKNEPVAIYNWVRNNIEYIPTYGSIQGSQLTLTNQKGNAFDTASLLIALYRAAGIPARYAYGTVQIPVDKVMNWVGGVSEPLAALDLLGQGGIPSTGLAQGGVIKFVKMEHIWVEAWVDYIPSRGAKHKVGDSWIALDASFKQYQFNDGMNIKAAVPFDGQGLLDQIKQTTSVNETDGSIQNIDQNLVKTMVTDYQARIRSFIDKQKPNATVGDVIGFKTIIEQKLPVLPSGLPYQTLVSGAKTAVLPDNLRHKIRLSLYGSPQDKSLDNPNISFNASLPSLAGKRLTFTYEPASSADQTVIDSAISAYQTQLPAYLIHVKPTLKADGKIVATGGVYTMGVDQVLSVEVIAPWYQHTKDYQLTAGDFHVIGLNPSGITAAAFDARSHQHDLKAMKDTDYREYTAEMFHQVAMAWWGEKEAFNDFIGAINHVAHYQLPSHTLAGSPLTVRYLFGIARSASYNSRIMDAREDLITAVHNDGDAEQKRRFVLALGYVGSYLEAGIYDQAFLMDPGHSMSSITALKAASEKGVAIYSIDAANAASLNQIVTDPDDLQAMRNAVAAGLRVTTAQRDITVDNFTGLGYILEDPKTGAAAYIISGGRNGADSPTGPSVYALPQFPANPIFGFMLRSSLRSAGAYLIAEGGVITGITLPDLAGAGAAGATAAGVTAGTILAAAAILMAIILIMILLVAFVQAVDEKYPRINRRFRHYTPVATAIGATGILFASPIGTFGPGVYLADALDEESKGMGCPPDLLSVATRFQLFGSDGISIEPKRAAGWIEITITRDNYYVIEPKVNSYGQTEYLLIAPLFPAIHWRTKNLEPALWIGEYQFGLKFNYLSDVCASLILPLLP
ncbi:MAG: transglutaminase domain-containing protein, partial [Methylococcaceae bacterium]|nr:transglutaminase domain-containing protein [Methylococcaceae bacterium]